MDGIVRLAAAVLTELTAIERARIVAPQIILAVVFGLLALAAGAGAIGCGIAALWIGIWPLIGSWAAPLACGGVLLLATAILIAWSYVTLRGRNRPRVPGSGGVAEAIESGAVTPLIQSLMQEHKWLLLALALFAGATTAGNLGKDPPRKP